MSRRHPTSFILGLLIACGIAYGAVTQIRLTTNVSDIGTPANGMTGAATTSATFALAGPASGAAAAYSFKTYPFSQFSGVPLIGQATQSTCTAVGNASSTVPTCFGDVFTHSSGTFNGSPATSTLPAYFDIISDTSGAACTNSFTNTQWYTGRALTFQTWAALGTTTGFFRIGLNVGGFLDCNNADPKLTKHAMFFFRSGTDTNWQGYTSDGVNSTFTNMTSTPPDTSFHEFKIVFDNAAPAVDFYIDGTLKAHHTANLPSNEVLAVLMTDYCKGGAGAPCNGTAQHIYYASHTITTTPF